MRCPPHRALADLRLQLFPDASVGDRVEQRGSRRPGAVSRDVGSGPVLQERRDSGLGAPGVEAETVPPGPLVGSARRRERAFSVVECGQRRRLDERGVDDRLRPRPLSAHVDDRPDLSSARFGSDRPNHAAAMPTAPSQANSSTSPGGTWTAPSFASVDRRSSREPLPGSRRASARTRSPAQRRSCISAPDRSAATMPSRNTSTASPLTPACSNVAPSCDDVDAIHSACPRSRARTSARRPIPTASSSSPRHR